MQLRSYAKKHQIPAQELIDAISSQFGGTWLLTSQLNQSIIDFLNSTFATEQPAQLPQAKETLQLPPSQQPESTQITPTQSQNLVNTQESTSSTNITLSPLEALIDADSVATQMIIQQRIEANNIKLAEMLNNRYTSIESQLIDSLQSKYNQIANYQPPTYTNQSQANKQAFDELNTKLEAYRNQSKSY